MGLEYMYMVEKPLHKAYFKQKRELLFNKQNTWRAQKKVSEVWIRYFNMFYTCTMP